MSKKSLPIPKVGLRIIKSTIAVWLCFVIYYLRGQKGAPFYSALAVLQCMQQYQKSTLKIARNRLIGTFIGAFWGLVIIVLELYILPGRTTDTAYDYLLVSLFVGVTLYSAVLVKQKETAYFCCVVFLSVAINHLGDANPFVFVLNRVVDTLIGVALGCAVNAFHLPRTKNTETLFISSVDDTIVPGISDYISPFSEVELNRMIDEGAKFTVATTRTPASVREALPKIHMELPIVAMDGAVLYDMKKNTFLETVTMKKAQAKCIMDYIDKEGFFYFTNIVKDDILVIYYEELRNDAAKDIYRRRSQSHYRNYVQKKEHVYEDVVYLFLMDEKSRVHDLYEKMMQEDWITDYRIILTDAVRYPGFAYIKVYDKKAKRERMIKHLQLYLGIKDVVTFGSIEGKYDVVINEAERDEMVREMKKRFEPIKLAKNISFK